jgi:hypothetical protein
MSSFPPTFPRSSDNRSALHTYPAPKPYNPEVTPKEKPDSVIVKYEFEIRMERKAFDNMTEGDIYDPDQVADELDHYFHENYHEFHMDSGRYPHVTRGYMNVMYPSHCIDKPVLRRDHLFTSSMDRHGITAEEEEAENNCLWKKIVGLVPPTTPSTDTSFEPMALQHPETMDRGEEPVVEPEVTEAKPEHDSWWFDKDGKQKAVHKIVSLPGSVRWYRFNTVLAFRDEDWHSDIGQHLEEAVQEYLDQYLDNGGVVTSAEFIKSGEFGKS